MAGTISKMQLGKNGVTDGFIETLKASFEKHRIVRISVLKSAGHEKTKVKEYSEEILKKLKGNFNVRIIGFTIVLIKSNRKRE